VPKTSRFGGELFIAELAADPWGATYLEFFQHDRDIGDPKGIVAIDLASFKRRLADK